MAELSLFDSRNKLDGKYLFFLVNRIQMNYFIFIMPFYLRYSYMIWAIITVSLVSQLMITLISKIFCSDVMRSGFKGYQTLFKGWILRVVSFLGFIFLFMKASVLILGYTEVLHQYMFPSLNTNWMIFFLLMTSLYVASHGIEKSLRFIVVIFLFTVWMIILYVPIILQSSVSYYELYPLLPLDHSMFSLKGLTFVFSALSGPEYLMFVSPWFKHNINTFKWMTWANITSMIEYVILFICSILFFGSHYLKEIKFPIIDLIRYIQFPIFERVDLILVSVYMFNYIFFMSVFFLFMYNSIRIILGKSQKRGTYIGFWACFMLVLFLLVSANQWVWRKNPDVLVNTEVWLGAISYLLIPSFLFIRIKWAERMNS